MIALELFELLKDWNTVCVIEDNPEYREWLSRHFGHWPHANEFSQLSVTTVDVNGHNMLCKGDRDYICWRSPKGVMAAPLDFTETGFLLIGSTCSGDPIVIDTHDPKKLSG